jgi:uncharacterized protein (TIGR02001 family)
MNTLQKTAIAAAISGLFAPAAFAQATPAVEVSPVTANVSLVSDYRFRGITQTNYQPAIQGGFDYAHESGLYVGNWNSTINWISNTTANGIKAPLEMNFYGGLKKEFLGSGFASDLGVLQYYYNQTGGNYNAALVNPNTTEIYLAQNYAFGPVSGFGKVNYGLTNIFGIPNSSGSYYLDLTSNLDTGFWGISLNGHIGYQYVAGQPGTSNGVSTAGLGTLSYTDWKLGATKDFGGGLSLSASYVSTNANALWWNTWTAPSANSTTSGGNQTTAGRGGAVVALTKTF